MPYFSAPELTQLTLPSNSNYWVKVQADLRYGDIKKFISIDQDGKVDTAAGADLFLETVIKEWNLDDESGDILPINLDNIDRMDKDDVIFIVNQTGGSVEDDQAKKAL